MPYMELTAEMLTPARAQEALARIGGYMLWPDDANARQAALDATEASLIANFANEVGRDFTSLNMLTSALAGAFQFVRSAPRMEDIAETAKTPYARGMILGFVLLGVMQDAAQFGIAEIEPTRDEVLSKFPAEAAGHSIALSVSTFENHIRRAYSPVGHLWAAFVYRRGFATAEFPCAPADVRNFLALSESIRVAAAAMRLKRGAKGDRSKGLTALLREGDTWKSPAALGIRASPLPWVADCSKRV